MKSLELNANEEKWYKILELDYITTCHFFQQFGLNREVIQNDFKKLYNNDVVTSRDPTISKPLAIFKNKYPVIYDCLDATFGLLPSNSRLMEQIHAMGRHYNIPGQSLSFVDAKRCYMTNYNYYLREERRVVVRKEAKRRLEDRDDDKVVKKFKSGSVHHDRTKETQIMEANQMIQFGKRYSNEIIEHLPKEIKSKVAMRNIRDKGFMVLDKTITTKQRARSEDKVTKSKKNL